MIKSVGLSKPQEHREHLRGVVELWDPSFADRPTLVVADLKSKQILQDLALERWGQFQNQDVLRAREFWQLLFERLYPEIAVVHPQFIQSQIEARLALLPDRLPQQSSATIFKMMSDFSSVLFNETDSENLLTWLGENERSQNRWGLWYRMALYFSKHFYLEKKIIAPDWIAASLRENFEHVGNGNALRSQLKNPIWIRPLIFDLGPELSFTEAEVIKRLGENIDCEILIPTPHWNERGDWLQAYQNLRTETRSKSEVKKSQESLSPEVSNKDTVTIRTKRKLPTPLAECEYAVAMIRQWANAGGELKKMALYAPKIETYWPALQTLLEFEGIPFRKSSKVRLAEKPAFQLWMQKLQLRSGEVRGAGVEFLRYSDSLKPFASLPERSEKLQAMTKNLIALEDLGIPTGDFTSDANESLLRKKFIDIAFASAPKDESFQLLQSFLLLSVEEELTFPQWLMFLKKVLQSMEIEVAAAHKDGIHLLNVGEADDLMLTHRIFLGLTQSQISPKSPAIVDNRDFSRLRQDRGFDLKDQEISDRLFDLKWLAEDPVVEDVFLCSELNWSGSVEAASDFWLSLNADLPKTFSKSRWQSYFENRTLDPMESPMNSMIESDRFLTPDADHGISMGGGQPLLRLSAHSLKKVLNCPFVYFSEKELGLLDPAARDVELSKLEQGQLMHRYVEEILKDPSGLTLDDQELYELMKRVGLSPPGPLHSALSQKHFGLLKKFQSFESGWRELYPEIRPLLFEHSFEFEFDGVLLNGKIDRIDQVGAPADNWVQLIDYKLTLGSAPSSSSWIKNNDLQMALYSWIIEKGGVKELSSKKVVAAYHISLKDGRRGRGFHDPIWKPVAAMTAMPAWDHEKKSEMFTALEDKIRVAKEVIVNRQFHPAPREVELCELCHWRGLCRAPHLM